MVSSFAASTIATNHAEISTFGAVAAPGRGKRAVAFGKQSGGDAQFAARSGERGVDGNRLIFAPRMELADHLARHRLADLFLYTLPYARTPESDALWQTSGSYLRVTFAGRVAASCCTPSMFYPTDRETRSAPMKHWP